MKRALFALVLLCVSTPSFAQEPKDDPEYLKMAISAVQAQRNNALDGQAIAEAKLAQANAKIKDLEDKLKKADKK